LYDFGAYANQYGIGPGCFNTKAEALSIIMISLKISKTALFVRQI